MVAITYNLQTVGVYDATSADVVIQLPYTTNAQGQKLLFQRKDATPTPANRFRILAQSAESETVAGAAEIALCDGDYVELSPGNGVTSLDWTVIWRNTNQTVMRSPLSETSTASTILTSNTAYWIYLGRLNYKMGSGKLRGIISTIASGAQTAEGAFATSLYAPDGNSMALTVVGAASWATALTGLGNNTSATITASIAAGSHLWAGIRTAMAGNQPIWTGLVGDAGDGNVCTTAAAGVLAPGAYTGAVSAVTPFTALHGVISRT